MIIYRALRTRKSWVTDESNYTAVSYEEDPSIESDAYIRKMLAKCDINDVISVEKFNFFKAENHDIHQYMVVCKSGVRYIAEFIYKEK